MRRLATPTLAALAPEGGLQGGGIDAALPAGDDDRGYGIADEIGEAAAFAHEAVDAEDQRHAGDGYGGDDRQCRGEG